jgi:4-amino-4-deoxy-L-arabinose transferase-like glycosyltransferase
MTPPGGGDRPVAPTHLDLAIGLGLFLAAWALRTVAPAPFVTWDEPAWVYRSVAFLTALQRGDWAGTLQVGHPGVLTMWGGALSLAWHRGVTGLVAQAQLDAIAASPWQVHDAPLLRQLAALLPLAKGGGILMQAALLVALYALLRGLAGRWVALAAALLLLSDPFHLALSRVLHLDALASALMLAAVLGLVRYVRDGRRRWLWGAGAALGLALLTKSYALLALPAGGLILWQAAWSQRDREAALGRAVATSLGRALRDWALWLLATALPFVALWPAMWAIPGEALRAVLGLSLRYAAQEAETTASFFQGRVVQQAGAAFYPVALWFRATPLTLAGAALATAAAAMRPRRVLHRKLILALGGYALLYLALVSLGLKKFGRYTLPALLALDVLGAAGWVWALEGVLRRVWRRPAAGGAAATLALIALQGALLLGPLYPAHYLAYYNPLAGGLRQAARTLPVGWGEGIEQAARHLAAQPDAAERTVATWAVAGLAPLYPGEIVALTPENLPQADAVLLYIGDIQAQEPLAMAFVERGDPLYTATVGGLPYAWVYEHDYGQEALDWLAAQAQPGDLAVANLPSTVQRRDRSAAAWLLAAGDDADPLVLERLLAAQLQAALRPRGQALQVFYLAFDGETARRETLRRLLAERGLLLARQRLADQPFEYGVLETYRLPAGTTFAALEPSQPLSADFGGQLALTAFGLTASTVQYRQEVGVALLWRVLQSPWQDYHLSLTLVDEAGHRWGQKDVPLRDAAGKGASAWLPGQEALTRETVPLDAGAPPGDYLLAARVYALADLQPLAVASQQALDGQSVRLATVRVTRAEIPPRPEELPAQAAVDLALGGDAHLLGYSLDRASLSAGEAFTLTLFWRCLLLRASDQPILWEWTLARDGRVWQSWQAAPAGADYPSNLWAADEVLRYPYHLAVSPDLPSGEYALQVAVVDAATGAPLAERVTLTALQVGP